METFKHGLLSLELLIGTRVLYHVLYVTHVVWKMNTRFFRTRVDNNLDYARVEGHSNGLRVKVNHSGSLDVGVFEVSLVWFLFAFSNYL